MNHSTVGLLVHHHLSRSLLKQGEKCENSDRFPLLGLWNHCGWWLQTWNQKAIASGQESYEKPRLCAEKQRQYSAHKGLYSQNYHSPSGYIWLWELDHKEDEAPQRIGISELWCWRRLPSPLDFKEIKPVNFKENQPWILIQSTDTEAETLGFWSSDANSWLMKKSLMLGKIEGGRIRGCQRMRWLDGIIDLMDMNVGKLKEMVRDREAWHAESMTAWLNNNNNKCVSGYFAGEKTKVQRSWIVYLKSHS